MNAEELVGYMREAIKPYPRPAVLISGGLDSCIVLHHLREKTEEKIHTYHIQLPGEDEDRLAERIAEHYETIHRSVKISNFISILKKLQKHLDRPRWNIWPYWGYKAAEENGCENVYIGEGLDEHFGGYWYKPKVSYQEYWSSTLEWSIPTHRQIAELLSLNLHIPYLTLNIEYTKPFWDGEHGDKKILRSIYSAYTSLPSFVLEQKKNPGRIDFLKLWDVEISPYIDCPPPETRLDSYRIINTFTMKEWLKTHD